MANCRIRLPVGLTVTTVTLLAFVGLRPIGPGQSGARGPLALRLADAERTPNERKQQTTEALSFQLLCAGGLQLTGQNLRFKHCQAEGPRREHAASAQNGKGKLLDVR